MMAIGEAKRDAMLRLGEAKVKRGKKRIGGTGLLAVRLAS